MDTSAVAPCIRPAAWVAALMCLPAMACAAAATPTAGAPGAATAVTPAAPQAGQAGQPALAATPPGPAASAARAAAPASGTRVLEDDRVRIEETRVRGQLRHVSVHSKLTGGSYEIIVGPGGRDPSQNAAQRADGAGQRAWSLLRF